MFRRLLRRPGVLLAVYWPLAFVVTHIPPLFKRDKEERLDLPIGPDKVVHFGGFFVLAWLLATVLSRRFSTPAVVSLTVAACAMYGLIDEVTQPAFGRTADVWDWVADMLGCGAGLLAWRFTYRRT